MDAGQNLKYIHFSENPLDFDHFSIYGARHELDFDMDLELDSLSYFLPGMIISYRYVFKKFFKAWTKRSHFRKVESTIHFTTHQTRRCLKNSTSNGMTLTQMSPSHLES